MVRSTYRKSPYLRFSCAYYDSLVIFVSVLLSFSWWICHRLMLWSMHTRVIPNICYEMYWVAQMSSIYVQNWITSEIREDNWRNKQQTILYLCKLDFITTISYQFHWNQLNVLLIICCCLSLCYFWPFWHIHNKKKCVRLLSLAEKKNKVAVGQTFYIIILFWNLVSLGFRNY